jgi:hypothetical protein
MDKSRNPVILIVIHRRRKALQSDNVSDSRISAFAKNSTCWDVTPCSLNRTYVSEVPAGVDIYRSVGSSWMRVVRFTLRPHYGYSGKFC